MNNIYKKDYIGIGIGIGFIIPLIFFGLVTFLVRYVKIEEHFQSLLYIVGVGFNALILQYCMKKGYPKTGSGILLISFIYAFLFFYYKIRLSS